MVIWRGRVMLKGVVRTQSSCYHEGRALTACEAAASDSFSLSVGKYTFNPSLHLGPDVRPKGFIVPSTRNEDETLGPRQSRQYPA